MVQRGVSELGLGQTMRNNNIIFVLMGISFGCSYSLQKVNSIDFVHTRLWKKLVRGILALAFSYGFNYSVNSIGKKLALSDLETHAIMTVGVNVIIPFVIVGPFVTFCQWIGLVDQNLKIGESEMDTNSENFSSDHKLEENSVIEE